MSNQLKISNVLKSHEVRIRALEQNKAVSNSVTPPTDDSLGAKRMKLIQTITSKLGGSITKVTGDVTALHELINKQNERMSNLYELLVLNQKEFLKFKQSIDEENKIELIVSEKPMTTRVEEDGSEEDSNEEDSNEEDSNEEDSNEEDSSEEDSNKEEQLADAYGTEYADLEDFPMVMATN